VDQDNLLLCVRGLLFLGTLEETIDAAMESVSFIRVHIVSIYSEFTFVAKLDVILSNFCWIGTLADPVMTVLLVVSNSEAIVKKDSPRRGRLGRRGRLARKEGTALIVREYFDDLFNREPPFDGGVKGSSNVAVAGDWFAVGWILHDALKNCR